MKKVLVFGCLLLSLTFCARKEEPVIVTVGDYSVGLKAYKSRVRAYLENSVAKDNLIVRKQIAQNMVHEILLKHYDDNEQIEQNPEYRKEQEWAKKEMILGYLKDRQVYARIKISDAEIRKAYKRSRDKIAARHLYAPTLEKAGDLYQKLQNGASWDSLARTVFTDSTLKSNGGYLGYFSGGDMDPAFEDTAFALKPGEISKPVKTAQGYSIIRVEDKKPAPVITENEYLNKKKAEERLLRISKKAAYEKKFLESVFDRNALSFDKNGLEALLRYLQSRLIDKELSDKDQMLLKYKDQHWNIGQAVARIDAIPAFHRPNIRSLKNLKDVLKSLLVQDILMKKAVKLGYDRAPAVIKTEQNAAMHVFLKYKIKEILKAYSPADSALRKYYETHLEAFNMPRMLNVREIITGSFQSALQLKARILKGESFGLLAKKFSLRKWSAQRNGEIGLSDWKRFGMLREKFWKAPLNRLLGPLKAGDFYGLFKVLQKVDAHPANFTDVREKIAGMYKKENEQSIVFAYLGKIYKKVHIKYNDKLIRYFVLDE